MKKSKNMPAMGNTNDKDRVWGLIVLIMLFAIIGFGAYSLITGKSLNVIEVILTALLIKFGTMIDYRYGSSKGSKDKTELLAESNTPAPPVIHNAAI